MENVMLAVFLCYCIVMTAVTEGQQAGNVEIENCKDGFIDIRENANNTILCSGFDPRGTLVWTFTRNGVEIPVATCGFSYCTVNQSDHFAVQLSPSHSTLFYQQYNRELDKGATVTCAIRLGSSNTSKTCTVNVINPATLSSCTVEEDRDFGTVRGSCRFDHAYSFMRGFYCDWYQEKVGESRRFTGTISSTSGSEDQSGWCTFTSTDMNWDAGSYTYTINFYPGPGNITVNVGNIATSSPDVLPSTYNVASTSSPGVSFLTTKDWVDSTSSPDVLPSTNNVASTSSPGVSLMTTKDWVDYTSPKTQEENDIPIGAIVGGIVAVVVVVIIVVVVVVVFVRRKRKQKPGGSAHGSGDDASNQNDEFEEHVNPMYVTGDEQDDTHSTDHKPSAIALRISPNSQNGYPAAPHSLELDMYTTVGGEASHEPCSVADRSHGYEDIDFDSNGIKRVPPKNEYAVVDKSRAKKGPASSANTSASSSAHTTEGSDEYAVVDKNSSQNKAEKNVASGLSDAATSNAGADVYAQVNKSAKRVKVAEPETEGAAYAQVQKPKPAVKPKTSAKPPSNKDVTQRGAADDDEYHTLSHTRGAPHTQDQADLDSQYSHISYN